MYGHNLPMGGITGLLILVVLGIVVYRLFRGDTQSKSASEVLDEKYVNGEISEEDYRRMKDNLKK